MIYGNILEATGQTPLIRLNHMTGPQDAQILVKFEAMNAGGSIKTRTALAMIETAEKQGRIRPGENTIVEPTSGNQGIGLALIEYAKIPEILAPEAKGVLVNPMGVNIPFHIARPKKQEQ